MVGEGNRFIESLFWVEMWEESEGFKDEEKNKQSSELWGPEIDRQWGNGLVIVKEREVGFGCT